MKLHHKLPNWQLNNYKFPCKELRNNYKLIKHLDTKTGTMKTHIAFSIDQELKKEFNTALKKHGLTAKAFFSFCIQAFIKGDITIGVQIKTDNQQ